jgi:ABC-type transport system substrate-binding protein
MSYRDAVLRRRVARRRLFGIAGAATAAAMLAACGGDGDSDRATSETGAAGTGAGGPSAGAGAAPAGEQPKYGGTLKVGTAGEPLLGFDAHQGLGGDEHQYLYLVMDQLIGYDQTGQLDPALSLAERWETPEPTKVVLRLRQGITFQDGTPFNAQAAKWNLDRILDPATNATPRADISSISSVQAASATEVVLTLSEPSAPLLTNFGDRGGMMVSPPAFERLGRDRFARAPVGTGQFSIKEWVSDSFIHLERNPNYWRKDKRGNNLPYLQGIRFEIIPETTVRVAALEAGQVDLVATPAGDLKRLDADPNLQSVKFVGSSTWRLTINHEFPPHDNVWLRRAIASAADKENHLKNFAAGDETLATGFLTPASWGHDPNIKNYPHDIAKAKEYLQRSGLPPTQWRLNVQPQEERITESDQFWDASLKEAGIVVDWGRPERGGTQRYVLKNQGADGSRGGYFSAFSLRVDPDGMLGQFYTQKGGYNPGGALPEVEPLVVKARQIYDQNERKKLYSEIQQKALDMVYVVIPLYYNNSRIHARKKVANVTAYYGGEGKPRYANLWLT